MTKIFNSKTAPKAVGFYSHGTIFQDVIYFSGQLGIHPMTNVLAEGSEAQTRQIMENIKNMLDEVGSSLENVIHCRVYLVDLNDFDVMNAIYGEYLGAVKPARTTIQVAGLPKGARVEIECTAKIPAYFN